MTRDDVSRDGPLFAGDDDGVYVDAIAFEVYASLHAPGPPSTWAINDFGQPDWLVQRLPWVSVAGCWAVLVPPPSAEPPAEFMAARELDRRRLGLPRWGERAAQAKRPASGGAKRASELMHAFEAGPAMMPAITMPGVRPQRRGQPGVEWSDTEEAAAAAWLHDICELTPKRVQERLFPRDPVPEDAHDLGPPRSLERKVARHIAAGRWVLAHHGVWPWAFVPLEPFDLDADEPLGLLPPRWWEDDSVVAHLEAWYQTAVAERAEREEAIARLASDTSALERSRPWRV